MTKEVTQEQDDSVQLARLGWQEIDCPICGGGARAFPKQEQGEPMGKFAKFTDGIWREVTDGSAGVPLYTTPQGCDECGNGGGYALYCLACAEKYVGTKEWVGLTEEELIVIKGKTCPEIDWSARHGVPLNNGEQNAWLFTWFMAFAKEIEDKLKDKNI